MPITAMINEMDKISFFRVQCSSSDHFKEFRTMAEITVAIPEKRLYIAIVMKYPVYFPG
jgi:hypothetical protein